MMQNDAIYYFHQGTNHFAYQLLGSHITENGVRFITWAPNAEKISVVGSFNNWDRYRNPMQRINSEGLWCVEIEGVKEFDSYKFAIFHHHRWHLKADPYAFHSELRPATGSKVYNIEGYTFHDEEWMKRRKHHHYYNQPLNIYELNLASWRIYPDGNFFDYVKIAYELKDYCVIMGYTHVELMPIAEFPYDPSWGYQVTSFYAITSRFGTPKDFMQFVDILHQANIGVIVDWVPGHFCKDEHGLIDFDGGPLYEPSDKTKKEHLGWGTRAFDYGRCEVQSFLMSNAVYLLKEFHIDGLRVDAVSSMLYLDYCRKEGEWHPNTLGTNINLDAVAFIQKVNDKIAHLFDGVLLIAEEATAYPNITKRVEDGGLGFTHKWNMGWMNDTLRYAALDPIYKKYHHDLITFQLTYVYSENYILPLSHDEVVHGKLSLLNKMPGDYEQKFMALETYMMYLMSHPGKKLTFMGADIAQVIEWRDDRELDWLLLQYPTHHNYQSFIKDLNHCYKNNKPFYALDDSWDGFKWLIVDDKDHNTYAYKRIDEKGKEIIVILNFAFAMWFGYYVEVPNGKYEIILSSNDQKYGGANQLIGKIINVKNGKLQIDLPANTGIYFKRKE